MKYENLIHHAHTNEDVMFVVVFFSKFPNLFYIAVKWLMSFFFSTQS